MTSQETEAFEQQLPPPAAVPPPSPQAARKPRWRRKRDEQLADSAARFLEPGEEVREIFMGQSRYSPIWLLPLLAAWGAAVSAAGVAAAGPALLTLILFGIVTKKRLIVVTDRCAYLLSKKVGSYQVKAVLQKERLGEVMADCGFTWSLRLGEGPPVYATFDSGVGVRKRAAALVNQPL